MVEAAQPNRGSPLNPFNSVFVGRQREVDELKAAMDSALAGRGHLAMLFGEPGIGKTRTAQELVPFSEQLGARVLWGRSYQEEGAPPYWPWTQILRSLVQLADNEQLQSQMDAGAPAISEIVPELLEMLPELKPPPDLELEQARFRLFDSITTFLRNSAQSQPLVLVLDDLHWSDEPSLLLLRFVARRLEGSRLLIVGTYRDVEVSRRAPLTEILSQLSREPAFSRLKLQGLSRGDTGEFITAIAGIQPTREMVEEVHAHTEGNPFFMTEIIRLLAVQGELRSHASVYKPGILPEGVREVIGQRLNRLTEQCHRILVTASVIGREFEFKLLGRLNNGVSEEELLTMLEEGLEAHLIEELPGRAERYQFTHALIQETLATELSAARRVRLHARVGEALEELYGAAVELRAAELAFHFARAEPVLGSQKLVHYSSLAGQMALNTHAHEEAVMHFKRALAVEEEQLPGLAAANLWFGLARAQIATLPKQRIGEALASLVQASNYYTQAGDVTGAVAVAEYPLPVMVGNLGGTAQIITQALDLVPPESHEAGRLLSRYIGVLGTEGGDYHRAQEAFGRALVIAQREKDSALELRILVNGAYVDSYHLQLEQSIEKNLKAIDLAQQVDDPLAEVDSQFYASLALMRIGEPQRSRRHASSMLALAEGMGHHHYISRALGGCSADLAYFEGDWEAARRFIQRAREVVPDEPGQLLLQALLESQVGNFDQTEVVLQQWLEALNQTPSGPTTLYARACMAIPFIARIAPVTDHSDLVRRWAEVFRAAPAAARLLTTQARTGMALLAVEQEDSTEATTQYAALGFLHGTISTRLIADGRLLGLLSRTMGDIDRATVHFEDALARCRKAGYWPEYAWSCHDYAETLLRRNKSADCTRATSLLQEALSISNDLEMVPLIERAAGLQTQARSQPDMATRYPDGLSQREVEVLRLIALGKSNTEIAAELLISANTVAHHVTNILNKSNSSNRTEAATYAAQNGIT